MAKRPMEFDMSGELKQGTALVVGADGLRTDTITVPTDPVPDWAVKVILSPEDYGHLIRHAGGRS